VFVSTAFEETPLSDPDVPTRGPARPGPYAIAGVIIVVAIVLPLIVPLYAFHDPTLGGMPFFYWYQLLWVPIDSLLLWITFLIMRKEDLRRREAVREEKERVMREAGMTGLTGEGRATE
jgi:hypothetical protein